MTSTRWLLVVFAAFSLGACAQNDLSAPTQATAPPPPPAPAASSGTTTPPQVEALYIYFERDSAKLSQGAMDVIDHAARLYREGHPSVMLVSGHADRTGQEFPNVVLSAKRAAAVKQAMVASGIPEATLAIRADGWADPPVPDQPNQSEAKDRVSVVTWH